RRDRRVGGRRAGPRPPHSECVRTLTFRLNPGGVFVFYSGIELAGFPVRLRCTAKSGLQLTERMSEMAVSTLQDDKKKALNLAISQIEKSCGKGSIMRLGADQKVRVEAISTGAINLDAAIGVGGIPRGRITEIYGPESSGKTTLCLHVVANAQKNAGGGGAT